MSLRRRMRLSHKQYPCSHTIKTGRACHVWKERIRQQPTLDYDYRLTFTHVPPTRDFFQNTTYNKDLIQNTDITYPEIIDRYYLTTEFLNSCIKGTNDHAKRRKDKN